MRREITRAEFDAFPFLAIDIYASTIDDTASFATLTAIDIATTLPLITAEFVFNFPGISSYAHFTLQTIIIDRLYLMSDI